MARKALTELDKKFPLIRRWHERTDSFPYYWRSVQQEAIRDGAPHDAVYKNRMGQWVTPTDINGGLAHPNLRD